jgi:aryl-alcohol dehydrogenase-like predicted oxidoreductase
MRTTNLGQLTVSAQGLGCMGMSEWYGATDWEESIATIHRALDLGVTFIDTADIYGAGHNEVLVGRGIAGRRGEVQLATKFGIDRSGGRDFALGVTESGAIHREQLRNGDPEMSTQFDTGPAPTHPLCS